MDNGSSLFEATLAAAHEQALVFLRNLNDKSVSATADLATLRGRLDRPLTTEGVTPQQVIADLVKDVDGGLLRSAGGRFFGWVIGGSLPSTAAADWLTTVWDQNAALFATSPAAAVVEEIAGKWLKEILQLPMHASFALVTGCQMAHVTCLAAARHSVLQRHGWDVEKNGLFGAPLIRIFSSTERHGSFERAVRLLGFGSANVTYLPTDSQGRLRADALESSLASAGTVPSIVILQAGDINIGSFDPFHELIPIARNRGSWVHVDGAFGLWVVASQRYRHLAHGVETADSWATDGHKWLNVPFDCGYAFVADADAHRASLSHSAAYITHAADARDEMDWNPEWSRRARGFATYAALRELGRDGVASLIERCCKHAHSLVTGIGQLPGAQILWEPTINQGLVRFLDPKSNATDEDHDRWTDEVIADIVAAGEAFFGGTTWRGQRAMRVSVCNWRTSNDDVQRTIDSVARVLKRKHEQQGN